MLNDKVDVDREPTSAASVVDTSGENIGDAPKHGAIAVMRNLLSRLTGRNDTGKEAGIGAEKKGQQMREAIATRDILKILNLVQDPVYARAFIAEFRRAQTEHDDSFMTGWNPLAIQGCYDKALEVILQDTDGQPGFQYETPMTVFDPLELRFMEPNDTMVITTETGTLTFSFVRIHTADILMKCIAHSGEAEPVQGSEARIQTSPITNSCRFSYREGGNKKKITIQKVTSVEIRRGWSA